MLIGVRVAAYRSHLRREVFFLFLCQLGYTAPWREKDEIRFKHGRERGSGAESDGQSEGAK